MAVTDSAWFFIWQRWKFFIYWKEEMLYTNLINKGLYFTHEQSLKMR